MKKTELGIASFGVLALLLSLPASAGEKVTGRDFDFQTLSELTAAIPDKPGHSLKQVTSEAMRSGSNRSITASIC